MIQNKRFVFPRQDVNIHLLYVKALAELIGHVIRERLFNGQTYLVADQQPVMLQELVNILNQKIREVDYPKYFRIPTPVFQISGALLRSLGETKLLTSLQLISENWTYDISDTENQLDYKAQDTLEVIKQKLVFRPKLEWL
jgi:hypothetical protein